MSRSSKRGATNKTVKTPPKTEYKGYNALNVPFIQGVPSDTGHDANPLAPSTVTRLRKNWNGLMRNQLNQSVPLWIEEIEADFELAGSYAQSRTRRQFYPHNIVQPSIKVTCIFPNQYFYNNFGKFVHTSHHYALRGSELRDKNIAARTREDHTTLIPTVRFYIKAGSSFKDSKTSKGTHRPMLLEGYIKTITSGAERFQYAPEMQFEFTIAESAQNKSIGFWDDEAVQGTQIPSWMDIFSEHTLNDFVQPKTDRKGKGKKTTSKVPGRSAKPKPFSWAALGAALKDWADDFTP